MDDEARRKEMKDASDRDMALLKKACAELGERFENVAIFASRFEDQRGTASCSEFRGNMAANYGMVNLWVKGTEAAHMSYAVGATQSRNIEGDNQ